MQSHLYHFLDKIRVYFQWELLTHLMLQNFLDDDIVFRIVYITHMLFLPNKRYLVCGMILT